MTDRDRCRESLSIGDDFGDNSSTHRCGHRGWHSIHRARWDDGNGNDVVLTWRRRPGFYWRWVCAKENCEWQEPTMCHDLEKKLRSLAKAIRLRRKRGELGGFVQSDDLTCIGDPEVHLDREPLVEGDPKKRWKHAYVMATFEVWR